MLKVYDSSWESPKGLDGYIDGSSKKDTLPETKSHQFAPEIRPTFKRPEKLGKFQLNQLTIIIFQGRAVCFRKYIYFFLFPGICKEQRLCGWWSISRLDVLKFNDFVCHLSIFFLSWLPQKSSLEQTIHLFFGWGWFFCGFSFCLK